MDMKMFFQPTLLQVDKSNGEMIFPTASLFSSNIIGLRDKYWIIKTISAFFKKNQFFLKRCAGKK